MASARSALAFMALLAFASLASAHTTYYYAFMRGKNERPEPVLDSRSNGRAWLELDTHTSNGTLKYEIKNPKQLTMIHIHFTGVNRTNPSGFGGIALWVLPSAAPPLKPIDVDGVLRGVVTFDGTNVVGGPAGANATTTFSTFAQWAANRQLYINVHTVKYGGGEIRGNFGVDKNHAHHQ